MANSNAPRIGQSKSSQHYKPPADEVHSVTTQAAQLALGYGTTVMYQIPNKLE